MHIKDNWGPNDKIISVPASWFNAVAAFVNTFSVRGGASLRKPDYPTEADPVSVDVPEAQLNTGEFSPVDPVAPGSYIGVPTFWGEFSGASGGGAAPTVSVWEAAGQAGHTGTGLALILTARPYLDNSSPTPNLVAVQHRLLFSADGRLLSVSAPYDYVISPTIAV